MESKKAKTNRTIAGSRCVICGQKKDGLEVKEDMVIKSIRYLKQNVTKDAKNYKLVVCRGCYPKYDKSRSAYVRKQISYVTIAVVFTVLLVIVSGAQPGAFAFGILLIAAMYALSLLSYAPAVKMPFIAKKKIDGKAAA